MVTGSNGPVNYIYLRNTGTAPLTFTATPTLGGTNPGDFYFSPYSCPGSGGQLLPNTSCQLYIYFQPTANGSRSATVTLTDSASGSPQTITLTGTGVAAAANLPNYTTSVYGLGFDAQLVGSTSPLNQYIYFYNNTGSSVTLGTTTAPTGFVVPHAQDTCSGVAVTAGGSCYVYVQFAPTAGAYTTGTLSFENSGNTAALATVALAGLGLTPTYAASADPTGLNFTAQQVIGTTSAAQTVTLTNNGNSSLTVGTINGTDLGIAGATAEFSYAAINGGNDQCSGVPVAAGATCTVNLTFTPNSAAAKTGTLVFPVTYANSSTANITVNLSGTGIAERNSAVPKSSCCELCGSGCRHNNYLRHWGGPDKQREYAPECRNTRRK